MITNLWIISHRMFPKFEVKLLFSFKCSLSDIALEGFCRPYPSDTRPDWITTTNIQRQNQTSRALVLHLNLSFIFAISSQVTKASSEQNVLPPHPSLTRSSPSGEEHASLHTASHVVRGPRCHTRTSENMMRLQFCDRTPETGTEGEPTPFLLLGGEKKEILVFELQHAGWLPRHTTPPHPSLRNQSQAHAVQLLE